MSTTVHSAQIMSPAYLEREGGVLFHAINIFILFEMQFKFTFFLIHSLLKKIKPSAKYEK